MNRKAKEQQALLWRAALIAGLVLEIVLILVALGAMMQGAKIAPWQQIAFAAILIWIYIAYQKQRIQEVAANVVDEKVKTHSLVENLDEGIILTNGENQILLLNARAAALTGLSELEALGRDLAGELDAAGRDMLHSGGAGEIEAAFARSGRRAVLRIKVLHAQQDDEETKLIRVSEPRPAAAAAATLPGIPPAAIAKSLQDIAAVLLKAPTQTNNTERARAALASRAALMTIETDPVRQQIAEKQLSATLQRRKVAVAGLLDDLRALMGGLFDAAGNKLEIALGRPEHAVNADAVLLASAVKLILLNAVAGGPGAIAVKTAEMGDNLGVSITDRGASPAPDQLDRLFAQPPLEIKDAQGRAVRVESPGLYTARGIIEAHGGSLWADIPSEGGLRVTMMLPRAG
jgi:signal transduction histidine kinase